VWVLQHVFRMEETVNLIARVLEPGGRLYVVNGDCRCVPTNLGYQDDLRDTWAELRKHFTELAQESLSVEATFQALASMSKICLYEKPPMDA